ncbi:MAG TPA: methyltransferase domain-containing protein [Bacteroidetes bacterium]|nr:methyltransferase domain-containing protein [Bacteroidota bacterium]
MSEVQPFRFKQFSIEQDKCTMKVGTDGILLGAWADTKDVRIALDIGTGTGLIAIMLAQRTTDAEIHAVEIDPVAHDQAATNMANSPWADRLRAILSSIQDYAKSTPLRYDLIVSNPPFFTGGTFSANQDKNSVRHTVKLPHGDLLTAVRTLLSPRGKFCAILPNIEGLRLVELSNTYGLFCTKMTTVKSLPHKPVERRLLQFERKEKETLNDELILHEKETTDRSAAFQKLTGAFYI